MAIKIQTEKPSIPIEIGKLKFEFDVSDESVKKFRKDAVTIQKELESIETDKDDDKEFEQTKDILSRGYALMLGEGAFEKVYKATPSLVMCMSYLSQISEGIESELSGMGLNPTVRDKAKKYLAKK